MAQPIIDVLGAVVRRAHWPILILVIAYLASGIKAVKADEVAVVLRWGRLVGDSPGEQIHQPGLLWAFPRPIDEVVRVQVGKVHQVDIDGLWPPPERLSFAAQDEEGADTIDPEVEGYCLTGDRNIVQILLRVRYRVLDPVSYALLQVDPHQLLRDVVQATIVRATGEVGVDDIMSGERDRVAVEVVRRAQVQLDELASGLELIAVEWEDFQPPVAVIPAFVEVMTAYNDAGRTYWEAMSYREQELPAAEAERDGLLADAQIYEAELLASARGRVRAFEDLLTEYVLAPAIVRERLWVEALERALADVPSKRFVPPPPPGEDYKELRITISSRRSQQQ